MMATYFCTLTETTRKADIRSCVPSSMSLLNSSERRLGASVRGSRSIRPESGNVSHRVETVSYWAVAARKKSGVKVDMKNPRPRKGQPRSDELVPVYVFAHDLRRAFGLRWAHIVPTTEKCYVGINARKTL